MAIQTIVIIINGKLWLLVYLRNWVKGFWALEVWIMKEKKNTLVGLFWSLIMCGAGT